MIVETGSGRTWLFERSIRKAIYGEVWRAVEVEIIDDRYIVQYDEEGRTRRVAVKRMPWECINRLRGQRAEDPMNEIAALALVSDPGHANILRQEAILEDGRVVYLVTPFVDGGELFDWVSEGGAYNKGTTETVRQLFRQLVRGMQYSHSKGICHADMSLENALVDTAKENAFIIDYGMSLLMPIDREYRRLKSVPDRRRAKRYYCCPETYKNSAYDGVKVDVFAGGAMLFMMLTGRPTFQAATRLDSRFKKLVWRRQVERVIRDDGLRLVGDEAEDLRQAVDLMKQMMAYKPENRLLPEQVLHHPWLAPRTP
ncbi:unnamed protein product [Ascophyllum nodosum]